MLKILIFGLCSLIQFGESNNIRVTRVAADQPGEKFDPTKHKNWALLDHKDCGTGKIFDKGSTFFAREKVKMGELPWLARLRYTRPDKKHLEHLCTGSILNKMTILTAAHCFTHMPPGSKLDAVVVGEKNSEEVGGPTVQILAVLEYVYHADYNRLPNSGYDVGLVRLAKPIQYTDYVRPICMIFGSLMTKNLTGHNLVAAGWVKFTNSNPEITPTAIKSVLITKPITCCNKTLKYGPFSDALQICAGGKERDLDECRGQSGGPLMMVAKEKGPLRVFVVGMISNGYPVCSTKNIPGLFTRLLPFVKWVLDNLGADETKVTIAGCSIKRE